MINVVKPSKPAPPPPFKPGAPTNVGKPVPVAAAAPVLTPAQRLRAKYPDLFNEYRRDLSGHPVEDPNKLGAYIITGPRVPSDAEMLQAILGLPFQLSVLAAPAAELREFFAMPVVKPVAGPVPVPGAAAVQGKPPAPPPFKPKH